MQIDQIIFNATIHTFNPSQATASAIAIRNERIVALGDDDEIRALATRHTQMVDAQGNYIFPGFTDAHLHWENYSRNLHDVDLWEVPSKEEALRRIKERADQTPEGTWIKGRGWNQDKWEGKQFPTATDIDAVVPNHPVYFPAKSGHAAWANSLAMTMGNITDETPDPPGGSIQRDANGQATGILLEGPAMHLVSTNIPKPTKHELADIMTSAQQEVFKLGLTGFHDYDDPSCMEALQILRERRELGLRVVKQINQEWFEHAIELGIRSGFGDDWIRFGGLKLYADGALGPRTALMIEPYENEPNNRGMAVVEKEDMMRLVMQASQNGLHSTIHAIGDRAVHDVLDVYQVVREDETKRNVLPSELRHRVEHVQIIHPMDVNRLAEMDVIASMQPIHATGDIDLADAYWGDRAEYAYAWRKQLNAGATLAFGSDAPIESLDPLTGIHAAVTRRRGDGYPNPQGWHPQERLNMREAIMAYTQGPAYAAGMEDRLGMLAENYLADLVILDRDLFTVEPMEILEINVMGTMVGGRWRYRNL